MNVLITGSNGFLGRELAKHIHSCSIFELNRNVGNFHCDLSNTIPYFENSFDLVLHNAGKAHSIPKTNEQKVDFFNVNVIGTQNLLKALEMSLPPKYFIFISSVSVYGLTEGSLINEKFPLKATDPYGLSKIEAENIVLDWCLKNNVICTILRLPLVVGPNPPGNLGSMIKGIKKGFYFNISGGMAKKSMVLAEDVAKHIIKSAEIGGIYNLTDGYHPSFLELSNHIAFQLGKKNPLNLPLWLTKCMAKFGDIFGNNAPINSNKLKKITSDLTFDDSKARKAFGWDPTPVLDGFNINQ
jgi:nucleoside-diphosphate-sugar epimerase